MERKGKLKETVEKVRSDVQAVTNEARETVAAMKETVRESIPRPLMRRVQKRVDTVLLGRGKRRRS